MGMLLNAFTKLPNIPLTSYSLVNVSFLMSRTAQFDESIFCSCNPRVFFYFCIFSTL